jgi:hypothetical protein
MIISHNQELMIHAIAFGSNNPMSKIGPSYIVKNEKDNISINELEELMDEIDDDTLEKDLRVEVIYYFNIYLFFFFFKRVLLILYEQQHFIH